MGVAEARILKYMGWQQTQDPSQASLSGNARRDVSRLISLCERRKATAVEALRSLQSALGHARIAGITEPPRCGKIILLDQPIELLGMMK